MTPYDSAANVARNDAMSDAERIQRGKPKSHLSVVQTVRTDSSRDDLLTDFGKKTLNDRYLLPGESYQDMFARVANAYADNPEHAQRLYDYMSRLWFMPATPVLSNGGATRGLPISCFLNSVDDSLDGIVGSWNENGWRRMAAVSAPIGAMSGRSAKRSVRTVRPAASSPSSG